MSPPRPGDRFCYPSTAVGRNTARRAILVVTLAGFVRAQTDPLAITTDSLPQGRLDRAYSAAFAATGGVPPYTWDVYSGTAGGLEMDAASGTYSGTPNTAATVELLFRVTDLFGYSAVKALTVPVHSGSSLSVVTRALPGATVGVPYAAGLIASGGSAPYRWTLTSGRLPPGLAVGIYGDLAGTPTAGGDYAFTLEVRDAVGEAVTRSFTLSAGPVASLAVTPVAGSGAARTFVARYPEPVETALFLVNAGLSGGGGCWVYYQRSANALRLMNDAGDAWLGPAAPGNASVLSNSQCSLDVAGVAATPANGSLTLTLPVVFAPAFQGAKGIWLYSEKTDWQQLGAWTVQ